MKIKVHFISRVFINFRLRFRTKSSNKKRCRDQEELNMNVLCLGDIDVPFTALALVKKKG